MSKLKRGTVIGFLGISLLLATVRRQQIRSAVVDSQLKLIKQYPGYQILACSEIIVQDGEKAFAFAFELGKTANPPNSVFNKLFGKDDCISNLNTNNAVTIKFAYTLLLYASAGLSNYQNIPIENMSEALHGIKKLAEESEINTQSWLTEKDIPAIIEKYSNIKP